MALTQELGRFVATLSFEKLPPEAMEIARAGFIDTVATMIAGAHDPASQLLRKGLQPAPGAASLYFSGETPHQVSSIGRQKAEVLIVISSAETE